MNRLISYLLLLVSLLSVCGNVSAQNSFAPVGAEWWYQGNNHDYTTWPGGLNVPNQIWTDHVEVIGDTIINGINSRKISVSRKYKNGAFADSIFEESTIYIYLYSNTDTVFVFNTKYGEFSPLYIYNVSVNDTIHLRDPIPSGVGDSLHVIVDSIVMEDFGGQALKSYYTRSYLDENLDSAMNFSTNYGSLRGLHDLKSIGKYTEIIGMTLPKIAGFFPYETNDDTDPIMESDYPSGVFICYKDNTYDIKMGTEVCDFIPTPILGIKSSKQKVSFTLSPNPGQGLMLLEGEESLPKGTFMRLYDLSGKEMMPAANVSGKLKMPIDVRLIPSGMYILQIEGSSIYSHHKIVVQH